MLGITKHISLCTSKKVQVIFILVLTEFVLQFEQQQNETFCQGVDKRWQGTGCSNLIVQPVDIIKQFTILEIH